MAGCSRLDPAPPNAAWWTTPALGVGVLVSALAVAWNPGLFMVDDAWFYLQIGANLADGRGSTFDGTTFTNGYHPLWQALVAGLAVIVGREGLLGAVIALQVALAFGALALTRHALIQVKAPFPEATLAALVLTQISDQGWGSEGLLTACLHGAALAAWARGGSVAFGAALGALFLARLDTVFVITAFLAVDARERGPEHAGVAGLAAAAVAGPWVGWTVWRTGHLVPVSGWVKSTFPLADFSDPVEKLGTTGMICAVGSLIALALAVRDRDARRDPVMFALAAGGLAHAAYVALFTAPRWSTFVAYYWITATLATGLAAGVMLERYLNLLPSLTPRAKSLLTGALIAGFAAFGAGRAARSSVTASPDPVVALARHLGQTLPADAVVLTLDAPGRLAWFSGRPVVAADGLTRDRGFSADVLASGMPAWARAHGVTHLVTYDVPVDLPWGRVELSPDGALTVHLKSPKSRLEAGSIRLEGPPIAHLRDFTSDDRAAEGAALYAFPGETAP